MSSNNVIEKILSDAKQLNGRLKARDAMADELITATMNVQNRLKIVKQFRDLVDHMDKSARRRPKHQIVQYLAKESHKIKELEEENAELRQSLEEHQTTLEIIMSKYREQMERLDSTLELESAYHRGEGDFPKKLQAKEEKIKEMAAVMKVAAERWEEETLEEEKRRDLAETLRRRNEVLRGILLDASGQPEGGKEEPRDFREGCPMPGPIRRSAGLRPERVPSPNCNSDTLRSSTSDLTI